MGIYFNALFTGRRFVYAGSMISLNNLPVIQWLCFMYLSTLNLVFLIKGRPQLVLWMYGLEVFNEVIVMLCGFMCLNMAGLFSDSAWIMHPERKILTSYILIGLIILDLLVNLFFIIKEKV